MLYRMRQRRGSTLQWLAATQALADGEIGIDKDTGIIKIGDGVTMWTDLPIALSSQYLPKLGKAADSEKLDGLDSTDFLRATGKAVDSDKLDGLDSTDFLRATGKAVDSDKLDGIDSTSFALTSDVDARTLPASATRKLVSHWGSGTSFPVIGVLQGDTFFRSDVGTNGSNWVYNGGTAGKSGWVHKGPIACTSTTRPASTVVYAGLQIYETDTLRSSYYDGTSWRNGALSFNRNQGGTLDTLTGVEFQIGMVKVTGNNTVAMSTVATFPVAFAAAPLAVFVNPFGFQNNGAFNPLPTTANWEGWSAVAGEATTTQMTIRMRRNDAANFGTAQDYYLNWMAIGRK